MVVASSERTRRRVAVAPPASRAGTCIAGAEHAFGRVVDAVPQPHPDREHARRGELEIELLLQSGTLASRRHRAVPGCPIRCDGSHEGMEVSEVVLRRERRLRDRFREQYIAVLLPLLTSLVEAGHVALGQAPVALGSPPVEAEITAHRDLMRSASRLRHEHKEVALGGIVVAGVLPDIDVRHFSDRRRDDLPDAVGGSGKWNRRGIVGRLCSSSSMP